MFSNPRGHVYIIDNEDFVNGILSKRNGSLVDSTNLEILFTALEFQVDNPYFTHHPWFDVICQWWPDFLIPNQIRKLYFTSDRTIQNYWIWEWLFLRSKKFHAILHFLLFKMLIERKYWDILRKLRNNKNWLFGDKRSKGRKKNKLKGRFLAMSCHMLLPKFCVTLVFLDYKRQLIMF